MTPLELVTVRFVPVALTFAALLLPTRGRQVWRLIRADGWRLALANETPLPLRERRLLGGPSALREDALEPHRE